MYVIARRPHAASASRCFVSWVTLAYTYYLVAWQFQGVSDADRADGRWWVRTGQTAIIFIEFTCRVDCPSPMQHISLGWSRNAALWWHVRNSSRLCRRPNQHGVDRGSLPGRWIKHDLPNNRSDMCLQSGLSMARFCVYVRKRFSYCVVFLVIDFVSVRRVIDKCSTAVWRKCLCLQNDL